MVHNTLTLMLSLTWLKELSFKIKDLTLLNRDMKEKEYKKSYEKIKKYYNLFELPDQFEKEPVKDLLKNIEQKKIEQP